MIKVLFLDVGGVLLTNGWGRSQRQRIASDFQIEFEEMESRHKEIFHIYETGKISFEAYLRETVFFMKRPFSQEKLIAAIFDKATPFLDMIDYIKKVKERHKLKIFILSNEGKELIVDRIRRFHLFSFTDCFLVSSFVGLRKPDPALYQLALDLAQVSGEESVYIDDRALMVEMGRRAGMRAIQHKDVASTRHELESLLFSTV